MSCRFYLFLSGRVAALHAGLQTAAHLTPDIAAILNFLKKWKRDCSGVTAIEFGIIALPFFSLLFAIIETALIFFGSVALENAVEQTSRLIRTGQAQTANMSQAQMKTEICNRMSSMFDCGANLQLELRTFPDFASASNFMTSGANDPIDGSGNLRSDFQYDPASGSSQIVMVRAFLEWDITISFPGTGLSNMPSGNRLLSAVTAFKNEPF